MCRVLEGFKDKDRPTFNLQRWSSLLPPLGSLHHGACLLGSIRAGRARCFSGSGCFQSVLARAPGPSPPHPQSRNDVLISILLYVDDFCLIDHARSHQHFPVLLRQQPIDNLLPKVQNCRISLRRTPLSFSPPSTTPKLTRSRSPDPAFLTPLVTTN
jgi:hypothetical protein